MAARDPHTRSQEPPRGGIEPLSPAALRDRLEEEISRAERQGTHLSCLLVTIEDLDEMAREHGSELPEQTLAYVASALARELRRFDRVGHPSAGELLIVLPGADGPRGEMVARRVLERMRAIKLETQGTRRPLEISVGLAAWSTNMASDDLLARTRAAAQRRNGDEAPHERSSAWRGAAGGAAAERTPADAR